MNTASGKLAFHLSLSVTNVIQSTNFYELLFGISPARQAHDYAKFEVDEPAVVLSLVPGPVTPGGALNHVGLRMSDSDALVTIQRRLETAGYSTQRENNVACCYSRQTKFWVSDPDCTLWEIYVLESPNAISNCAEPALTQVAGMPEAVDNWGNIEGRSTRNPINASKTGWQSWQHWLGQPIPETIPQADAILDEVRLEGAFNQLLPPGCLGRLLAEVRRVLKPGALLHVHGLVADRLLPSGRPSLPGPAALVERVPLATEPERCITAAGFVNVRQEPCREEPYFVVDGIGLRELKLTAEKAS